MRRTQSANDNCLRLAELHNSAMLLSSTQAHCPRSREISEEEVCSRSSVREVSALHLLRLSFCSPATQTPH